MLTLSITPEQIDRAKNLYKFAALKNSITGGGGNLAGALGEVVVSDLFPGECEIVQEKDHDLIIRGRTVDIKTKLTTVAPEPKFSCSVPLTSKHQKPQFFMFVRVTEDMQTAYVLGWISRAEFYQRAVFRKKGEKDGAFTVKADCYNVKVSDLKPIKIAQK